MKMAQLCRPCLHADQEQEQEQDIVQLSTSKGSIVHSVKLMKYSLQDIKVMRYVHKGRAKSSNKISPTTHNSSISLS